MNFLVEPSALQGGNVTVPGDKSISHRALLLGSLAAGETRVSGFLAGEDCLCTLAALRSMGVAILIREPTELHVTGVAGKGLSAPDGSLDMGNSGTAMRLFAGMLAGQAFSSSLVGDASLSSRPMGRVLEPLVRMGAKIDATAGKPPLRIHGGRALHGIDYSLPVASAQVKSAILLAGLYASGEVTIVEPAVTRDHTERMLRSMGVTLTAEQGKIGMRGGQQLQGTEIRVPADLSSAAFPLLAAILSEDANITIPGVGINPTRTGVIDILQQMGGQISLANERCFGDEPVADITARSSRLQGIDVSPGKVSLAIDEFPLLFVAAACAAGQTRFSGIGELRVKESDRIASMANGLRALGITVHESADGAVVHGGKLTTGQVHSFGDHRVAMALAVGATVAEGPVTISDTDPVATSFPGFETLFRSLGVRISSVTPGLDS